MSYRIAYMLLLYDDPVMFAQLAIAIESTNSALFVHVDASWIFPHSKRWCLLQQHKVDLSGGFRTTRCLLGRL